MSIKVVKEKKLRLSLVLSVILIILLVWDGCGKRVELSAFQQQISKLRLSGQAFTQTITKDKKTIAEQEQVILAQREAIRLNLFDIERYKNAKGQIRIVTETKIDSVFVPYFKTDTIYINSKTPFVVKHFSVENDNYSINGKTQPTGILLDSISFNNAMKITIADKPNGLFRKSTPIVSVEYDNPYVQIKEMQNVIIKDEKKWFHRRGTWFGVGIGMGLVGGILLMN
jgi:hypothetical protein